MSKRIDWGQMRVVCEREGELKFANSMIRLINEGAITKDNFSLGGLHKALGEPRLGYSESEAGRMLAEADLHENMDSSAFPKITGALINKTIQEAYDLTPGVGDQLVRTLQASQKDDTIVGFTGIDELVEVVEGDEYQQAEFGEKYHKIATRKFGKIISLTEEMIRFDQTGQMIMRAQSIGEAAKYQKEYIIMYAICEKATTGQYASWRPGGTSTALYSDTSTDPYGPSALDNVITSKLVDETDIGDALAEFASMVDEKSRYLAIKPTHLLTGLSYEMVARKLAYSTSSIIATENSGVINPMKGQFEPVASPFVDAFLGAPYWLYGDFKKQFVYVEVFPVQTFQAPPGNPQEFNRDVKYQYKTRLQGGCGAISNRFVIRSTGAS
jgi:hypothetical protein